MTKRNDTMYERTHKVYRIVNKPVYICRFCKVYSENKLGIFLHEQQCCHNPIYLKMLRDNGLEGHLIRHRSSFKEYLLKIDLKNRMKPFLILTIFKEGNDKQALKIERIPELLIPYRDIIVNGEPIYFKKINGDVCMNTIPECFKEDENPSITFDIHVIAPRLYNKALEEEHIDISNLELIGDDKIISPVPNKGMLNTYPATDQHSPRLRLALLIPKRNTDAYFDRMEMQCRIDNRCLLNVNTVENHWLERDDNTNVCYDFYIDPDCPRHGCRHSIYYTNDA